MAGIGHDRGPVGGRGFRTHCWRPARTALPGAVVRIAASGAVPHLRCGPGLVPKALRVQTGVRSAQDLPHFGTSGSAMRDRIRTWLRARGLPGDAVLMIGETEHGREMMTAGWLAGVLAGQRFFAGVADAV